MRYARLLLLLFPAWAMQGASFCDPAKLAGPYAFQLAGETTISGRAQPTVAIGQITFDGNGKVAGTASTMIAGFLLGNPVTGMYDVKQDCTVTWQLQDDSGAYQHFSGKYTADGMRVQFRQTDVGGVRNGTMQRTPDSCGAATLARRYNYDVSGSTTPMNPSETAHQVSDKGVIDTAREGDFEVDQDCSVHFTMDLPDNGMTTMRGFLVNGGKEILAFQTDPGAMVSAKLKVAP